MENKGLQEKEWLTSRDVCELTGYSIDSIRRLTHQKKIPHYKMGRLVRFKYDEINKWIESGKVECWV